MGHRGIKKRKLFETQFSPSDPQRRYYHKIIAFLEEAFPTGLSIPEAFALMTILQFYQIRTQDDFVINDPNDDEKVIGCRDAAIIASHLCTDYPEENADRIHDYRWWTTAYYSQREVTGEALERVQEKLLGRLMLHPKVQWIRS